MFSARFAGDLTLLHRMFKNSSVPLVILVIATSFFGIKFLGVSVADYLLLCLICFFAIKTSLFIGYEFFLLLFFLIICALIYIFAGDFSGVLSYAKLLVYAVLFVVAKPFISRLEGDVYVKSLHLSWRVFAVSSLAIVLLFFLGFDALFNVVEAGVRDRYNPGISVYKVSFVDLYRFNGYMQEPSWFALWSAMLVGLILYCEKVYQRKIFVKFDIAMLMVLYALAFSFTAIIFFITLMLYKGWQQRLGKKLLYIVISFVSLGILISVTEYLRTRIMLITAGEDGSFTYRFIDTFRSGFLVLRDSGYVGVGIGNVENYIGKYQAISLQNAPMEILAATGFVGLSIFLLIFFSRLIVLRRFFLIALLVMAMFVASVVYTPVFWVFLLLMCAPLRRSHYLRRPCRDVIGV